MATKKAVLEYLKHDRSLLSGRNLYNKFQNKNLATQSYIANLSNTPNNIRTVCYELCRLVGIAERQMTALLMKKVVEKPVETLNNVINLEPTTAQLEDILLDFTPEMSQDKIQILKSFLNIKIETPVFSKMIQGNKERKQFVEELEIEVSGSKNEDYDLAIEAYSHQLVFEKIEKAKKVLIETRLKALKPEIKQSIKIRTQFPFLRDKNCPKILQLLVADLISAWDDFKEKQPLLHKNATQEQLQLLVADVTSNYINRKEIFAELEHFAEMGILLGKHPKFKKLEEEEALIRLDAVDLAKKIRNLTGNINRNKNKLKKAESLESKKKYKDLIEEAINLRVIAEKELKKRK
ncbi:hypothetical protein [Tenacibaculum finnmarkense]|uniref:hypothetical protein n=1 Tax=Tenacibaculum finnmarkense TaxID=2781243 RepID=UPI00187B43E9|nr:hypothetical protein [Tenacibaculum finnmarkense]MBE7649327.1 hypothetical protein [Tenacibaculum finnmarkense genomovar ulcerans]